MKLNEVCQLFDAQYASNQEITGVSIDSRTIKSGQLFIAIRGDKHDGHDYVESIALGNMASAALVEKTIPGVRLPQIVVPNTIEALAKLASFHRDKMKCKIIALTGSNGKTTVKEMIAAILPQPSLSTIGNLNNQIGLPLSVLKLEEKHQFAVFELGASHKGDIAPLVEIVKPHVALINNIAPAHIQGFGSIDGVAEAKGEIYQGLQAGDIAVVNDDDKYCHFWDSILADKTVIRYSIEKPATLYAKNITFKENGTASFTLISPQGEININLKVPGIHNVRNALAAASATYTLQIPLDTIAVGLERFQGVKGRMTFLAGINDSLIIDDTYNANLRSTLTALDVLAERKGRRIFVFGDMAELGDWSKQHHEEVGLAAKKHGIEMLMTCGKQSEVTSKAYGAGKHYGTQKELVNDLVNQLDADTTVLVKGSRSSAMEKIVQEIIGG